MGDSNHNNLDQSSSFDVEHCQSVYTVQEEKGAGLQSTNENMWAEVSFNIDNFDSHSEDHGSLFQQPTDSSSDMDQPPSIDTIYTPKESLYDTDRLHMATHDYAAVPQNNSDSQPNSKEITSDTIKFNPKCLSYELLVGYKILISLMGTSNRFVNKLFMNAVDPNFPETKTYYEKIKEPMWMNKMKEKFETDQYDDINTFLSDFRLMIENCYRFNGPDNFVSKKAQKLETMMKQKLALVSKDIKEKIKGAVSVGSDDDILTSAGIKRRIRNPNADPDDPSQALLHQLRRDRVIREREDRRQRWEDRKALEQARVQELKDWDRNLLGDLKEKIKTMWELPQIGMFIYLCMENLGLEEEITQYQLERGLIVPRECYDFKRLMTCLLSTQHQRKSIKTFMPYKVWNKKLTEKFDNFYKILADCAFNQSQACFKMGLDTRVFRVLGVENPLRKKQFHELSFLKRVWIVKSCCEYCIEHQTYLAKSIEETDALRPMDTRETLLGSDGRGNRYINFPMFTGKDIRIYRHSKLQEPTLESLDLEDWSFVVDKPSGSSSRCSTPLNQRGTQFGEAPPISLRAKALLQAAGSACASPNRESSRASSEMFDNGRENSPISATLSESNLHVSSSKKTQKRKLLFRETKTFETVF